MLICSVSPIAKPKYICSRTPSPVGYTDRIMMVFHRSMVSGTQWTIAARNTRLQRLIGAFCDQSSSYHLSVFNSFYLVLVDYVWALNTDRMICSSDGLVLEKPRQAQYLTHASFVPDVTCQGRVISRRALYLRCQRCFRHHSLDVG